MRQLALVLELPFIPLSAVLVAGGAGYFLDEHFRTSPLFTLVLGGLGFAAGIYELLRRLRKEEKSDGGS